MFADMDLLYLEKFSLADIVQNKFDLQKVINENEVQVREGLQQSIIFHEYIFQRPSMH